MLLHCIQRPPQIETPTKTLTAGNRQRHLRFMTLVCIKHPVSIPKGIRLPIFARPFSRSPQLYKFKPPLPATHHKIHYSIVFKGGDGQPTTPKKRAFLTQEHFSSRRRRERTGVGTWRDRGTTRGASESIFTIFHVVHHEIPRPGKSRGDDGD